MVQKKNLDQDSAKLIQILESDKPYHEKLAYVKHELSESVREINFNYKIFGFLEDAAYALNRAVQEVHGFSQMQDQKGASKDNPPEMLDVKFANGTRIKVPFGTINLPQFGKKAFIEMAYDGKNKLMILNGVCEKRYSTLMDQIVRTTERLITTESIYKNQAIKYDGTGSPEFMDLTGIDKIELFLTDAAAFATEPIEARIEQCDECEANGIDLKFGALLEGDYGTGKTLYASKLAAKAIRNDWTFIYCSKPENTLEVLKIANKFTKNGKGIVLFIEDIDKILNDRTTITNEISLLMDGSETKDNNLISIFSTNHIERIDPTFLRGKRIGSIVTLTYLDEATAKKMIHHYLGENVDTECNIAAKKVEEYQIVPAFLSEIIDRVKTHAILRNTDQVTEKDILNAIEQFKRQMDIAKVKLNQKTDAEILHDTATKLQKRNITEAVNEQIETHPVFNNLKTFLEQNL
jgi:transitional endoplasmic reticulum ATPase